MAILVILVLELGSYVAFRYFVFPRDESAFYIPPEISRHDYEQYLHDRHATLGWLPFVDSANEHADSSGSRHIPSFPDPGEECGIAFGDSFIYGDEVGHSEAWSNVLSNKLHCRVANYGVSAFGTDQALMRYQDMPAGPARFAILGIYPHNLMRNVNQNRYFLNGRNRFGLKPRFVLENDELKRIPMPDFSYEELVDSFEVPRQYYPHEGFVPDTKSGPITPSFPYTVVLLRYLSSDRVKSFVSGWPSWTAFVRPGHDLGALELTAAIVAEFSKVADDRKQSTLVVVFPTAKSYQVYLDTGQIAYQPLLDIISENDIEVLDLHAPFRAHLGNRPLCDVLTNPEQCVGHFGENGNALVAEFIYKKIADSGLLAVQ